MWCGPNVASELTSLVWSGKVRTSLFRCRMRLYRTLASLLDNRRKRPIKNSLSRTGEKSLVQQPEHFRLEESTDTCGCD